MVRDDRICLGAYQHGIDAQIFLSSPDRIADLKKFCRIWRKKRPQDKCYHGVGHEIVRTTSGDVIAGLKFCDTLEGERKEDIEDCYAGVFSEYANIAINFDTDRGMIEGEEPKLKIEDPYDFCANLDAKYHSACYPELTRLVFVGSQGDEAFLKCLNKKNSHDVQIACVRRVSGFYTWINLHKSNSVKAPEAVLSFTQDFKEASILGTRGMFSLYAQSGIIKDYDLYCLSFKEQNDIDYCRSLKTSP
jgi:hypothetical protein